MFTKIDELCQGLPEPFYEYINYCRKLKFNEKPDYSVLRNMFKSLFKEKEYKYDYVFDWSKTDVDSNK